MAARKTPRARPAGSPPRPTAADDDADKAPVGIGDEITDEMAALVAKFLGAEIATAGAGAFATAMKACMADVELFAASASTAAKLVVAGKMALKQITSGALAAAGALTPAQAPCDDEGEEDVEALKLSSGEGEQTEDVSVTFKSISRDDEQQLVTGVVLIPNETDYQLDIYGPKVVQGASHNWLSRYGRTSNLGFMHKEMNPPLELCESWIAREDCTIGTQKVKAGTWLMTVKVLSKKLWEEVKAGKWTGFSIGGKARVRKIGPAAVTTGLT